MSRREPLAPTAVLEQYILMAGLALRRTVPLISGLQVVHLRHNSAGAICR